MGVKLINNLCINGSFESYVQKILKDVSRPLKCGMFICDLWKVINCPDNATYKLLSSGGIEFSGNCSFGESILIENIGIDNVGYVEGEDQHISALCRVTNMFGDGNADVYVFPKSSQNDVSIELDPFTSFEANQSTKEVTCIAKTVNKITANPTTGSRVFINFKIGGEFKIKLTSFTEISGNVSDSDIDLKTVVTSSITDIQSINCYIESGSLSNKMIQVYQDGGTYYTDINVTFKNNKLRLFDAVLNLSDTVFKGVAANKTLTTLGTPIITINKNSDFSGFVIHCDWGNSFTYDSVNINSINWLASI